jgi:hypothetical protein
MFRSSTQTFDLLDTQKKVQVGIVTENFFSKIMMNSYLFITSYCWSVLGYVFSLVIRSNRYKSVYISLRIQWEEERKESLSLSLSLFYCLDDL